MATKRNTKSTLEDLLNASSDHDNKFILNVYLDAIKADTFPDAETPVRLFAELKEAFHTVSNNPEKVIPAFEQATEGLTNTQKIFLADHLHTYFMRTVFGEEEVYLSNVSKPLSAYLERLKKENGQAKIHPGDLRETLLELVQKEIANLPAYFETLTPNERIKLLCKFMPFILSRAEPEKQKSGAFSFDLLNL